MPMMDVEDVIDRLWWVTEESTDGCYLTMQRVKRLPAPAGVTPCAHDENGAEWEAQLRDHTRSSADEPNATAFGATPREAKEALLDVMRQRARGHIARLEAALQGAGE